MYRAKVVSITNRGRIQVQCDALYGTGISGLIEPASGTASPAIGSTVWIALENGDKNKPVWLPLVGTV